MKALITLLVLGSSSVAFAHPTVTDHRQEYPETTVVDHRDMPTVRDHRQPLPAPLPPPTVHDHQPTMIMPPQDPDAYRMRFRMMRPVTLASNVSMVRYWNRDHRPLKIDIDQRNGAFKKLRLDRVEGRMHIDSVVVLLPGGRSQTYAVDQTLSARMPSLTVDIDNRAITGVYIYGNTQRGRAALDVIGLRR